MSQDCWGRSPVKFMIVARTWTDRNGSMLSRVQVWNNNQALLADLQSSGGENNALESGLKFLDQHAYIKREQHSNGGWHFPKGLPADNGIFFTHSDVSCKKDLW